MAARSVWTICSVIMVVVIVLMVMVVVMMKISLLGACHDASKSIANRLYGAHVGRRNKGRFRFRRQAPAAPLETICPNTLSHHSYINALFVSAKLTPVAPPFIHLAIHGARANIFGVFLNGTLKKAFAPLAGSDAIMLTGCIVTANSTDALLVCG